MPQAILLQDVETLGERGTVVDVSAGYLRNFLLPRKLAEPATKGSIEAATRRRESAERAKQEAEDRARENAATLGRTASMVRVLRGLPDGNRACDGRAGRCDTLAILTPQQPAAFTHGFTLVSRVTPAGNRTG